MSLIYSRNGLPFLSTSPYSGKRLFNSLAQSTTQAHFNQPGCSPYRKLLWAIALLLSLLPGCQSDTTDQQALPDIFVTDTTTQAIQAAIDAAPPTGAHIILPPGQYLATARVNLTSKNRVTLDGQGTANWVGSSAVPCLFVVLGNCRSIRLTGINFSTTAGPGTYYQGLISTFEQSFIDGYEIDHCRFTAPNAPINLISFLPYSPINESGTGRGAMHRNINIHHCVASNGGRAFCELNTHVHADGRMDAFFETFRFCHNTVTNMGTRHPSFGPALSLSGMGSQVVVDSNLITDAKYAGLEFVNNQQVSSRGNRFQAAQNVFSAYAFTRAGTGKNSGITLSNNSGTITGRAYVLHDVEYFSVTGDHFRAAQKVELIRAKHGALKQINLTVTDDANALLLAESEGVRVENTVLTTTHAPTAASVIVIPASSRANVVRGNRLNRPAGAKGNFVESEANSRNILGPNVEQLLP